MEVAGQELTALSDRALATLRLESIGFVFQAYNLLPVLSALENAEFTLLLRGVPAPERSTQADPVERRKTFRAKELRQAARPGPIAGGVEQSTRDRPIVFGFEQVEQSSARLVEGVVVSIVQDRQTAHDPPVF